MDHRHIFRNLMVLAAADGRMTEEEITFLSLRATRWGITEPEFQAAVVYASSKTAEVVIPSDPAERRELLRDMIRMMAVDGDLAPIERKIFATVAGAIDIAPTEISAIIDSLVPPDARAK